MEIRRKAYDELIKWKSKVNHKPLIVEGLRQVGKSFIVNKFAKENYKNVIVYDFRYNKDIREIFNGNLDVDTIITKSKLYFPNFDFEGNDTVLIFEEINYCPLARTSLKSFAQDNRYDVIATGSLLGVINFRRKTSAKIPTGYEEYLKMTSLDFEEFLWASGIKEDQINMLKESTKKKEELDTFTSNFYKKLIKDYIAIGGLPEVVSKFVETNGNYIEARNILDRLITDYRSDFGRFINDDGKEEIDYKLQNQLNLIFDSIPKQLARESGVNKFKFSDIKNGSRFSDYIEGFKWLESAGLVLRCFNLKAIESPLSLNVDESYFKAFISDTGLLMAMYPLITLKDFLNDKLDSRKGAIYESLAAVLINKAGFPLYYYSNGTEHLEVDFILESSNGIVLYEEKSTNGKMAASRNIMLNKTKYKAICCYKIIENNFGKGEFYTSIPQFCSPFLLEEIKKEILNI